MKALTEFSAGSLPRIAEHPLLHPHSPEPPGDRSAGYGRTIGAAPRIRLRMMPAVIRYLIGDAEGAVQVQRGGDGVAGGADAADALGDISGHRAGRGPAASAPARGTASPELSASLTTPFSTTASILRCPSILVTGSTLILLNLFNPPLSGSFPTFGILASSSFSIHGARACRGSPARSSRCRASRRRCTS